MPNPTQANTRLGTTDFVRVQALEDGTPVVSGMTVLVSVERGVGIEIFTSSAPPDPQRNYPAIRNGERILVAVAGDLWVRAMPPAPVDINISMAETEQA